MKKIICSILCCFITTLNCSQDLIIDENDLVTENANFITNEQTPQEQIAQLIKQNNNLQKK